MRTRVTGLILLTGMMVAADEPATPAKGVEELQGTWRITALSVDGRPDAAERVKKTRLVIKGNDYSLLVGDETVERGTLKANTGATPKTLDYTVVREGNTNGSLPGIYEAKGDTLRWVTGSCTKTTPRDFTPERAFGRSITATREKTAGK